MNLQDIVNKLELEVVVGNDLEQENVTGVYVCDLLSNVMAHGQEGNLWITIQTHQNILAVATLLNFAGILLPEGLNPDKQTLEKAEAEGVIVLKSSKTAFNLAGELYQMGLKG